MCLYLQSKVLQRSKQVLMLEESSQKIQLSNYNLFVYCDDGVWWQKTDIAVLPYVQETQRTNKWNKNATSEVFKKIYYYFFNFLWLWFVWLTLANFVFLVLRPNLSQMSWMMKMSARVGRSSRPAWNLAKSMVRCQDPMKIRINVLRQRCWLNGTVFFSPRASARWLKIQQHPPVKRYLPMGLFELI